MATNDDEEEQLRSVALQNAQSILAARRGAEEALRKQSEWLRVTLASIGDAVISTDAEGRVTFMNGVAETLTGWTQAEAWAVRCRKFSTSSTNTPASRSRTPRSGLAREHRRIGEPHRLIARRERKAVEDSAAPIRDPNGGSSVRSRSATWRKIGERNANSKIANVSSARWPTRSRNWPGWPSPDGHIFWYNRRWYEYTGTTPGADGGWGWQSVHDPEVLPQVLERW